MHNLLFGKQRKHWLWKWGDITVNYWFDNGKISFQVRAEYILSIKITFFPRMTAPASPWITMYFVPPRCKPVGARWPGWSKSFIIPTISSGLNWKHPAREPENVLNPLKPKNNKTSTYAEGQIPPCSFYFVQTTL